MIDKDARIRREITIWLEDSGGNPTTPPPPAAPIGPLGPRLLAPRIRERGMFPGATRTFGLSQLAADDCEQGRADHSCACDLDCISSIEQPRFRGTSGPAGCDVRCGAPWEAILDRLSLACLFHLEHETSAPVRAAARLCRRAGAAVWSSGSAVCAMCLPSAHSTGSERPGFGDVVKRASPLPVRI